MNYSRRDFNRIALGMLAAGVGGVLPRLAAAQGSAPARSLENVVNGVRLGVISYSFRAMERRPGED